MVNTDYAKEVGMGSKEKKVPVPYVILLLAIIIAVGWYGFYKTQYGSHPAVEEGKGATAPAASPGGAAGK